MSEALRQLQFGPHFEVAARTIVAPRPRDASENQDNFLLIDCNGTAAFLRDQRLVLEQKSAWPLGHIRLALMDGMGGHRSGREVAEAVATGLSCVPAASDLNALSGSLEALHRQIQTNFPEKLRRPGTTLIVLEFPLGAAPMLFHVGDSRLIEVKADSIQVLTVDHVPATSYALRNEIDEAEWRRQVHDEDRSIVSQAFVLGNTLAQPGTLSDELYELSAERLPPFLRDQPDRRALHLDPHSIYVLASDGLWSYAEPKVWLERWPGILQQSGSRLQSRLDELFAQHILASAGEFNVDNSTAVAFRVLQDPS